MKPIPISAAKEISEKYGYDQVIIVARAINQGEHVTTYGRDKANCDIAARLGDFLKFKVMGWAKEPPHAAEMRERCADECDGAQREFEEAWNNAVCRCADLIRTVPLPPSDESFLREKIERAIQDTFAACMVDGQVPTYESIMAEAAKERT